LLGKSISVRSFLHLEEVGLFCCWCVGSKSQIILTFGWVETTKTWDTECFSEWNHDISVSRVTGFYLHICGCIWIPETRWFYIMVMCQTQISVVLALVEWKFSPMEFDWFLIVKQLFFCSLLQKFTWKFLYSFWMLLKPEM